MPASFSLLLQTPKSNNQPASEGSNNKRPHPLLNILPIPHLLDTPHHAYLTHRHPHILNCIPSHPIKILFYGLFLISLLLELTNYRVQLLVFHEALELEQGPGLIVGLLLPCRHESDVKAPYLCASMYWDIIIWP
jgi:hypothetical protein